MLLTLNCGAPATEARLITDAVVDCTTLVDVGTVEITVLVGIDGEGVGVGTTIVVAGVAIVEDNMPDAVVEAGVLLAVEAAVLSWPLTVDETGEVDVTVDKRPPLVVDNPTTVEPKPVDVTGGTTVGA